MDENLTDTEKINLGTKEIAKRIRNQVRAEFPNCVFSVSKESYSGGSSITICLMKAGLKVVKPFSELSEKALFDYGEAQGRKREDLQERQEDGFHQLNEYCLLEDYDPDTWNNGVFLTEAGHSLFKRVVDIVNKYNYDHSDPQTDYFSTNFYLHLQLGNRKLNRPLEEVALA